MLGGHPVGAARDGLVDDQARLRKERGAPGDGLEKGYLSGGGSLSVGLELGLGLGLALVEDHLVV